MLREESSSDDAVILVPEGRLVMGGPAEEFEKKVQDLFAKGTLVVVADMHKVTQVDSTGIRGFVRGHSAAQRNGGRFALAGVQYAVQLVLEITRLNSILEIHPSVEDALEASGPAAASN